MSDPHVALLQLGLFIFLIMLGFPVCFTLMAMGVAFGYYAYATPNQWDNIFHNRVFDLLVNQTYSVMTNDVLVAVPLFLFMGYIVERAGIVDRLFFSMSIAARKVPASLAVATLFTCALFATATGIVGAVVTLMGLLAFPAMLRAGYDIKLSSGVVCAGGCLGIMIPPSILLIVYGATSGVSVVRLYAGALIPGFILAALYVIYVTGRAILNPALAPKPPKEESEMPFLQLLWVLLTSFVPLSVLILGVLGAVLFGFGTPSEAAAVGAGGALMLALSYRELTWERLKESVFLTVRTTAMVCWLFVGSSTFSSVFSYLGGEAFIKAFVEGMNLSPFQFMLLAQIIIFLLGWPLEWTEIIIIFVPIFLPLVDHFKVDPLFFGVMVALNLQTAFLSPPMAMACFYLKGIAPPHVTLADIFRGAMPFMVMVIMAMAILYMFPELAMWLPDRVYGVAK